MKNIFTLLLFVSIIQFNSYSQETALKSICDNDLEAHLKFIASDLLKGRKLGSVELDIASQYLAANLKKMNIAAINDNYFQYIEFTIVEPDNINTFINIHKKNTINNIFGDSILNLFPHPKDFICEDPIVFAGYGIIDSVNGYNDFENINIKDKVVLIMSRTPNLANINDTLNNEPFLYHVEFDKVLNAYKNGAKAVLWVLDPLNKNKNLSDLKELYEYANQAIYPNHDLETNFPIEFTIITQHTANLILESSGKTLLDLQSIINKKFKPASFEISDCKVRFNIKRKVTNFKSPNVIGYIEGSDSILKNEYIIYTAHYDHLGVDEEGNIFNGADDNGSGTVALLELAEAYMLLSEKPKRTIIFAWMTAEENGGIGSSYFVDNPIFPIDNILCCINLDCIGRIKSSEPKKEWVDVRSKDSLFVITCDRSNELTDINTKKCKMLNLIPDYSDKYRLEYSDQYFFYKKGVPVLFYHTGFHEYYHSINDDIEEINYEKIKRITQLAFLVGLEIANSRERLKVNNFK